MPYCESCGSQVGENAKFCGNCGTPRNQQASAPVVTQPAAQPKRKRLNYYSPPDPRYVPSAPTPIIASQAPTYQAPVHQAPVYQQPTYQAPSAQTNTPPPTYQPQPAAPLPQQTGEAIIGVITFRKMKSLGRYDAYGGVITNQRLIFAQLTSEMINATAQQARDEAKAEGKGFFGQWANQLRNSFNFTKRFLTMQPDAILAEMPGNFAVYNNAITEIKVHLKGQQDDLAHRDYEAEIKSTSGTYKFHMDENSQNTDLLQQVYGNRVKMPFGHFSKTVNIKL